ncbi:hypothetical protein OK349_10355 [Sphingomonas sp. BT-65]|uniref:hypothetical protein n=1 Tax=Sphingomonas sp. BT-65 TaxID=2989821 RepID=UPI0022355A6E|nr:hypothetical protein [Sphingomonas sp. BT-65]MCW4462108.1 hypothetical protein [Sphingomonas sp. BT-65]
MPGDSYKPAAGASVRWGCVTAGLVAIFVMPATLFLATYTCPRGTSCHSNMLILVGAFLFCALIGFGVGAAVHVLTRNRDK